MLEGFELGAEFAMRDNVRGTKRGGAIAGATLGLAQSYANTGTDGAVRETFDEDIYKEYLKGLANRDLSLPD
jgi:hypothetical protein